VRDVTPTSTTDEAYGAGGNLLWRYTGNSNTRSFVPFQGGILAEYYSGETIAQPLQLGSTTTSGGTIFDHPDQLGSITTSSDYTGNNLNVRLFYPYGELWTGAALPSFGMHQTFAQLPDYDAETDQYNTLARHYSPRGRWMSPDPGGVNVVKLDDPQTWNMYAYVRNNPTTFFDPTGLTCQTKDPNTGDCHPANSEQSNTNAQAGTDAWQTTQPPFGGDAVIGAKGQTLSVQGTLPAESGDFLTALLIGGLTALPNFIESSFTETTVSDTASDLTAAAGRAVDQVAKGKDTHMVQRCIPPLRRRWMPSGIPASKPNNLT
jgi:RHS repeat-associated protein